MGWSQRMRSFDGKILIVWLKVIVKWRKENRGDRGKKGEMPTNYLAVSRAPLFFCPPVWSVTRTKQ